jgi:DNA adenine methylase
MSRAEYEAEKTAPSSARRAWACFAASHSGKPWGGYGTTSGSRDYLNEAANLFEKRCAALRKAAVLLRCVDYRDFAYPTDAVVYADPPYADSEGYGDAFDTAAFWEVMADLSERCQVFVSEYTAPQGWEPVWSVNRAATIDPSSSRVRVESLWTR